MARRFSHVALAALTVAAGLLAARPAAAQTKVSTAIRITVADAPDPVTPGGILVYTITATNHGPDDETVSAAVYDVLPAGAKFVSLSSNPGWTCTKPAVGSGGTVACTASTLRASTSAVFTLTVSVDSRLAYRTQIRNQVVLATAGAPSGRSGVPMTKPHSPNDGT